MRMWTACVLLSLTAPVSAQTLGSTSGASSAINVTNPDRITTRLITTPTVVAPGLAAAGIETCLGSSSGGLSLMGGGVTFGGTIVDDGCTIRLLARQLHAFGLQRAAVALMCQDQRVAIAMDVAGSSCPAASPGVLVQRQVSSTSERPVLSSVAPERPISQKEQAWFDRASN